MARIGQQAIVIGAGMAGLAASAALRQHFDHVLVLERDILPASVEHRVGTPQSRHVHALLGGGMRALDALVPGFRQRLARAGAIPIDFPYDLRIERRGFEPFPQRRLDIMVYCASRALIESTLRDLVRQCPNMTLRDGCRVRSVVAGDSPEAGVTGVRVEAAGRQDEIVYADLVVDASGRGNLTRDLLASVGQAGPEMVSIEMDLGYSTAVFEVPDPAPQGWTGVSTVPDAPDCSRGGLLLPREGSQWIVTLWGLRGEKPEGGWEGFMDHARRLRTRTIHDAIADARRVGDVHRFLMPASVLWRFEQLDRFPRGLLPIGDAICRFNPVFGQGMSVAAIQALELDRLLQTLARNADPLAGLAQAYLPTVADIIRTPWSAANLDLIYPETIGPRPDELANNLKFGAALVRLAARDPHVHRLSLEVQHLLQANTVLRTPELVRRVEAIMAEG